MDVEAGKLKLQLKQWESTFFGINKRKPSKSDIAKSPQDIQEAYRTFWKFTKNVKAVSVPTVNTDGISNVTIDSTKIAKTQPKSDVWNCELNKTTEPQKVKRETGTFLLKIGQNLKRNVENLQRKNSGTGTTCRAETQAADEDGKRRHEMRCALQQQNDQNAVEQPSDFDLDFNVKVNTFVQSDFSRRAISLNPIMGRHNGSPGTPVHPFRGLKKAFLLDYNNPNPEVATNENGASCSTGPASVVATTHTPYPQTASTGSFVPTRNTQYQDHNLTQYQPVTSDLPGATPLIVTPEITTVASIGTLVGANVLTSNLPMVTVNPDDVSEHRQERRKKSPEPKDVFSFHDDGDSDKESAPTNARAKTARRKPRTPLTSKAGGGGKASKSCQDPSYQPKKNRCANKKETPVTESSHDAEMGAKETQPIALSVGSAVKAVRKRTRKSPAAKKVEGDNDVMASSVCSAVRKSTIKSPAAKKVEGGNDEIAETLSSDDDELPKVASRKRQRPAKAADQGGRPKKVVKTSASRNPGSSKPFSKPKTAKKKPAPTENYVRVNLKKKVFCRGKTKFNYRRYKFDRWKEAKQAVSGAASTGNAGSDDDGRGNDQEAEEELRVILEANPGSYAQNGEAVLTAPPVDTAAVDVSAYAVVAPLFEPTADGTVPKDILKRMHKSLKRFGHDSFRPGQQEAIARVLSGRSTLVLQPTGAGKSLTYLVAAHLYSQRSSCITVVISPLVSLMDDQVSRVPSFLRAESLHTNMTRIRRDKVREAVCNGEVDILFLSPEAVVGGAGSPFGCLPPEMPPIAFVCIDEVHCISSWSHNFRPSYLRVCWVVHEKLKVRCVLGLTATITQAALANVSQHLRLADDPEAVVRASPLPSNLRLTVSRDNDEQALLHLLRTEPFVGCKSIIVYCIRREQTERLAILIRTCMRGVVRDGGEEEEEWMAEAYHAGLSAARRRTIQNQFMSGHLRVVTATVAFGMGLNKSDVRGVIHHSMPKSVESYVQEIGRAGRDGIKSFCHLFLDVRGDDRRELKRHIYADSVDRSALAKLLRVVFVPCRCAKLRQLETAVSAAASAWKCPGHEVAFSVDDTVQALDIKEEVVDTLLAQLEAHPSRCLEVLNRTYGTCNLLCYGGADQLLKLAADCPPVAYALAMARRRKRRYDIEAENRIEFPLVEVAAALGTDSVHLRRQLRKLVWTEEPAAPGEQPRYRKSGIMVEFKDLYFHVKAVGDMPPEELDALLDNLHAYVCRHESDQIEHLDTFYSTLHSVSFAHHWSCEGELCEARSERLKDIVRRYFDGSQELLPLAKSDSELTSARASQSVEAVRSSVNSLLSVHHDHTFTGRAVARIFHGISSPLYPAEVWGRVRQFWRAHLDHDFNEVCRVAKEEIVRYKRR